MLFERACIEADKKEIMNFCNKYIKTIKLAVDDAGNFSFSVNH